MCKDETCKTCYQFVVLSDVENCAFGPFDSESGAIKWAKYWKHWPISSWKVLNVYPTSIG